MKPNCSWQWLVIYSTLNLLTANENQDFAVSITQWYFKDKNYKAHSESIAIFFSGRMSQRECMGQTVSLRSFPHSRSCQSYTSMAFLFAPSVGHTGDWVLIVDGSAQIHSHSRKWLRAHVLVLMGQKLLHPTWRTSFFNRVPFLFSNLSITLRSYKQLWKEILWPVFTCYALLSPKA